MKLSQWAEENHIQYGTALRWFHNGNLPLPAEQLPSGTILVYPERKVNTFLKNIVYARVSNATKKTDLASQESLCQQFCVSKGWEIHKSYREIASGMNDNRPKLNHILDMDKVRLIVLHKDRLSRFGFRYIEHCVKAKGGEIVVINPEHTDEHDLMKDFVAIITSFCCRLYGARRGQAKALRMKESL